MPHTLSLYVENKSGVLARVAGVLSGRGFNIDSLTVAKSLDPGFSLMTVVVDVPDSLTEQVIKQLSKLINVVTVTHISDAPAVVREMVLVKVSLPDEMRSHLLQEADLFIMPSLITPSGDRDGIPNVVLEALLHEVPVVATEISGLPEVIRPGTTGWLIRAADPERLARAVQEACADPREARRLALAGRDLVAREFDSKRNYTRLKALFDGLAGEQTAKLSHI